MTNCSGWRKEVDDAVKAAKAALKGKWGKMTTDERIKVLRRIGDLIESRLEELAELESLDTGKPIWLSRSVFFIYWPKTRLALST